ncbi:hypothetical protein TNCV_4222351 [Trichonephila clavipes]|nr:hypothetical protein TNCV_4222351 [Trichonephila clavipes]
MGVSSSELACPRLNTKHNGRQTCADNVVTNGNECCFLSGMNRSERYVYVIHGRIVKQSCFVKRLVSGVSCSMKKSRMSSMNVEMSVLPHPQMKTTLLEYRTCQRTGT